MNNHGQLFSRLGLSIFVSLFSKRFMLFCFFKVEVSNVGILGKLPGRLHFFDFGNRSTR